MYGNPTTPLAQAAVALEKAEKQLKWLRTDIKRYKKRIAEARAAMDGVHHEIETKQTEVIALTRNLATYNVIHADS